MIDNSEKKRLISGLITGSLLLLLVVSCLFLDETYAGKMNSALNWSVFLILLGTLAMVKKLELPEWLNGIGILFSFVLVPRISIGLVEYLVGMNAGVLSPIAYSFNVLFAQLMILFFFGLTCNYRFSLISGTSIVYIFGVVNHFVQEFRGTPFLPADILAIGTAADVAGNYTIAINQPVLVSLATLFCVFAICSNFQYKFRPKNKEQRLLSTILLLIVFLTSVDYYKPEVWHDNNLSVNFWNQHQGYQENGSFFSFIMNIKYLSAEEPAGYSKSKVNQLAEKLALLETPDVKNEVEKPHIIMIMNESYADLDALGDLETTLPYMETYDNLTENVTKGNLYVSVLGGGTCNTEFEALTGNTIAFMPIGSMPYQQYIDTEQYSLATILKEQGYATLAFHPGKPDSWRRDKVYPLLGFEEFLTKEDMQEAELMRNAYVTDSSNYAEVIHLYENRGDEPLFLFNVTIQNHGGYQLDTSDIPQWVSIVGEDRYPQAEQYLSLMYASDKALAELLAYFEQEEEPVMVVFFGDHQPVLEERLTEALLGKKLSSLSFEQVLQRYNCPFFIWTNYESESAWIEQISANYLPSLILSKAGLEMPLYQQYLLELSQEIPVINALGYITKNSSYYQFGYLSDDGKYYQYGIPTPWSESLKEYAILQYNLCFDTKYRVKNLHTIQEGQEIEQMKGEKQNDAE